MEAEPVLAAAVVLAHVIPASELFTVHPAGGKVAFSIPSTIGGFCAEAETVNGVAV